MSILEKLGLARKKSPSAPIIGERKKQQEASSSLKHNIYVRAGIILAFLVLLILSVPQTSFKGPTNYSVGEPWRAEDLTAPFNFAINKSTEEIQQEREAVRQTTAPIFHVNQNADIIMESRIDSVFRNMQPVLQQYAQWQSSKENNTNTITQDSLSFIQAKSTSNLAISDASWNTLLENYWLVTNEDQQPETKTAPVNEFIGNDLRASMKGLVEELLDDGIINVNKEEQSYEEITIRDLQKRTEQNKNLANVRDLQEAREFASYRFTRNYYEDVANAANEIFSQVLRPNLIYNQSETQAKINEALSQISSSKGAVAQGQVIIRRGDIVTRDRANVLKSLADARAQNASNLERWLRYGGDVLAILAIVTIFFFYLYLYRRSIFENNAMLLLVLIAMSIICVSSSIVYELDNISAYIVPTAITPIILTIIFDSRVGLLSTITLALLTGLINGNDFEYVTATTVACSLGLFSVRDIKKRSQFFFTTPGIVFLCYAVVIIGFNMTGFEGWGELFTDLQFLVINAIFILFTYPLILLFEKSFNVTTDFTLIELSDTNLPLLKDLMTKAPGTFHHSLQVANLAEAAAGNIGANGLLCRVGALYHDIGKMENPGYFTENQTGANEHDKLKPRMSALVIKAHVSNGVKMAEEQGLPEIIIDFVKTHHGTSTIKFFYDKALKNADADKDEIREEDFKYDGPLPRTKETGILLLADGVEAASKAMKDPNYQKLENLITKMVDERVYEGQLSKTPLTFQDLRAIKESFLNILVGIYHSRVEYPEDEKKEKKSSKTQPDKEPTKIEPSEGESSPPVDDYQNS
ncbi:MAG: HDIG domain-containing protein [Balneolaceae bacterium]|nr:HDIG domain-containing protein [Balneolaceae bacterium]